ncbi:MAG: aminopeptidase P N-terminal domain-containing protein, partial [Planctomycetota bacterium]|nr:aminopeptidase P N-terminal domain-containing protein [Planctomycetota bacterium]
MLIDHIPLREFASRRTKLLTGLKASVALVFAGEHDPDSDTPFRPHAHFEYLTGIVDEPGAVLLLDPTNPVEDRRSMLLLAPLNPEREKWDGYRLQISRALRERTGLQAIFRTEILPRLLNAAAVRSKRLACLHPPAQYDQPISPDLALFTKVAQRLCGIV